MFVPHFGILGGQTGDAGSMGTVSYTRFISSEVENLAPLKQPLGCIFLLPRDNRDW